MAYANVAQLRAYLKQLPTLQSSPNATQQRVTDDDALLSDILERATSAIDAVLEFSFAPYGPATVRTIASAGGRMLALPAHEDGSVTSVTNSGSVITGYTYIREGKYGFLHLSSGWPCALLSVTAKWGVGPAPTAIVEVCLELAVNIWRSRDRGMFSDVIGIEASVVGGGGVAYSGALTKHQQMVLAKIKRSYEVMAI